ncbi:thiamine pyrophosphate-dependent dehydrogenase E1 component subunit alpha [Salinadaptatus halalkaliphilus]|uniref:Thiamine pyrophosphate-dependent dehydrogenase E1 component subunit alpha n=1 Tax=Salinadaptatus halalkaliphilus TaxID=2419781 RepID=A0A4S3TR49_9EURY|nr:thiamine pyrophosphate-dependent dehydrogenase E1 component subunit alpha [Salinadaptatus halalkaliphilus]THE66120.1 thiamine pyrophosphate-dependent dehydrogenase E1 component subunit alpha [Salinadaptatus halalkaliphilus]
MVHETINHTELLEDLLLTRRFEEKVLEVYQDRGIRELPHSSLGQEAVGVGACYPLEDDDLLAPSLRTRAAMLLRTPVEEIVAGMYGTESGPSSGRTTEHHMGSSEYGILGTTGMIGSHLNPAVGAALGNRTLDNDRVTVVFFGDGASQRGEFHSALNFATVQELPVVFVIENNQWTEAMSIDKLVDVDDLADLAGHGLPTEIVDGQDVEAMVEATAEAADRARSGDGPTLLEAKTYRYRPHAETMPEHRDEATLEAWKDRDPVEMYIDRLLERDQITEAEIESIDEQLQTTIDDAFDMAESDELPDEETLYHVYKDTEIDHWKGVAK